MTDEPSKEVVHVTAKEMPIAEVEGEMIRLMFGTLPRITLPMDFGYARGTHLKIELDVRVRRFAVDEMPSGKHKGELFREHTLVIEEAKIIGSYTEEEADPGVGGSLSSAEQLQEQEEEAQEDGTNSKPVVEWEPGF